MKIGTWNTYQSALPLFVDELWRPISHGTTSSTHEAVESAQPSDLVNVHMLWGYIPTRCKCLTISNGEF